MKVSRIFGCVFVLLLGIGADVCAQKENTVLKSRVDVKKVVDSTVVMNKGEVNGTVKDIRENLAIKENIPDSLPKVDRKKFLEVPKVDSIGVSYENGKLNLPDQIPSNMDRDMLKKSARDKLSTLPKRNIKTPRGSLPDQSSLPDKELAKETDPTKLAEKIPAGRLKEYERRASDLSDSALQLVKKGEELLEGKPLITAHKIYSEKALKKISDSLGLSKLDTVLALAATKKEVSKEELLTALNFSMPATPMGSQPTSMNDIPEVGKLKNEIATADLSSLKLPQDVLQELPPMRGLQFPADKFPMLDSLRKLNLMKADLTLNEEQVRKGVASVIAKKKSRFWDKTYFEGVVSYLKDKEANFMQMAPGLGFRIDGNFSLGLGPNVLVKEEQKKWNVYVGYRSFAKFEFLSQRAYAQVEDITDPGGLSKEYFNKLRHSILLGGGFLLPISKVIAVNFSLLYRVNNNSYSNNQMSPWVFRLGLSSVKSVKK